MSEYQFYEFQTIDRALTDEEQAEVGKLSSRVALTPTQAVFTYHFGDFRGKPEEVLERYFDAMLYLANWGTRRLMFRLPKALVDLRFVRAYEVEDVIEFRQTNEHVILDMHFQEEDVVNWVDGEGHLSSLVALRDDLLRRDYRVLYLAWLKAMTLGAVDVSETEPPLPPGLRSLSSPLRHFVELFEVDKHLLTAAVQESGEPQTLAEKDLHQAVGELSRDECDRFLLRLARGEPHVDIALNARLQQLAGLQAVTPAARRGVGQLLADAERARQREEQDRARDAERKHRAEIEALAQREDEAWQEVHRLLQKYSAKDYETAVQLTAQLREVAVYAGHESVFRRRLSEMFERYKTRHSLLQKLRAAGLHPA